MGIKQMPIEFLTVGNCNTDNNHMLAMVKPTHIYAIRFLFRIIVPMK